VKHTVDMSFDIDRHNGGYDISLRTHEARHYGPCHVTRRDRHSALALMDALHVFDSYTGKAETNHDSYTERGYQNLPTLSIGAHRGFTQTRDAIELDVPLQQIIHETVHQRDLCLGPMYTGHGHSSLIDTSHI